ncbi:CHAT domain-containing protein [Micromonospora saelicesensis]|uniref:CHAT domain-containing protein n=1 Tax=Micromonospora saelicesensis TaxID=285676 RepID=UPI003CF19FC5
MSVGFFGRFVDGLDTAASQQEALANAVEALEAAEVSEFSRCLRSWCLEVSGPLRAADLPGWKIVPDAELPFSKAVVERSHRYLNAEQEAEFSSAVLAQLLFRSNSKALTQVGLMLRSMSELPAAAVVQEVAEAARRVTEGVAQSYALPADRATVDGISDLPDSFVPSPFEGEVSAAIEGWTGLPSQVRGSDILGSGPLVRLAIGRGADQRTSRWLKAVGLNMIDFSRVQVAEQPSGVSIAGVAVSQPALEIWNAARWLSVLGQQALSTDRIILAALTTPASHLATYLTGMFGPAVNLPLLYLRTATPPGISKPEAQWLIAQGDANARPGPSDVTGDLCARRVARLQAQAEIEPGFDAVHRLRAFAEHNEPNNDFPLRDLSFVIGDAAGVARILRSAQHSSGSADADIRRPDGEPWWSFSRYQELLGSDLGAAYLARRQLAACQLGPLGLRTLASLGPSSGRIGELLGDDPELAIDAVSVAHCLEAGVRPYPPLPLDDTVRLSIGGTAGRYALAVAARQGHRHVAFELSAGQAILLWQAMRRPALAGDWANVAEAMRAAAAAIGIDQVAALLNGRDVEFTVVRPFDGFMIDQMIRAVSNPRSIVHRVFGARAGQWAGHYAVLRRAGGTPLVIDDPSDSLASAKPEAVAVGSLLGATRIGGAAVRRVTVLRMLEAETARPPVIHFTGHGRTGLVGANGDIASGVIAASDEAVGVASLAQANMPRVVIASACDVGATPPIDRATAWSTSAIALGASYTLAPGLPVDDTSALVFAVLVARQWSAGVHLEAAVAAVCALGRSPAELLTAWDVAAPDVPIRRIGRTWIRQRTSIEIAHCMAAFSLSGA